MCVQSVARKCPSVCPVVDNVYLSQMIFLVSLACYLDWPNYDQAGAPNLCLYVVEIIGVYTRICM